MNPTLILIAIVAGAILLFGLIIAFVVTRFLRQVDQGKAIIINTWGKGAQVAFSGVVVYPIINRAEMMDISVKTIDIDRRGKEGLICADNIRADIKVTFFVRVNKTPEDVLKVAQSIGCARASDQSTLDELFSAKFSEALKTVGKRLMFEELYTKREQFKDELIEVIGRDLNGYILDDAAIDFLEQTPMSSLDPHNILDAQGIRKITEITAAQNVRTNELRQKERMDVGSQNLASDEAVFRYEQQRADAEAKKHKEIAMSQAREQNEAMRVASEEHKKTMLVQQANEAEIGKSEQDKQRAILIAEKAKEREVQVETERVEKARATEAIARERAVELLRIEKEKALEIERKAIADVVRERVSVEKGVAEEEERTKDVRVLADANRVKESRVIKAEGEAQERLVKDVKNAQAMEEVAKHEAKKQLILAEAALESADKQAKAKIREAEGLQAQEAAQGLANVRVKEADAVATEKLGMAKVRVQEAEAGAIEKRGMAENTVARERFAVEASGEEQKGLAQVRVKEADAAAIEKQGAAQAVAQERQGVAQATAIREKLLAEAAGLAEKGKAMQNFAGEPRAHEEFRLQLERDRDVQLAQIAAQKTIAEAQARVLATALEHAKINIVGGDGQFFDKFVRAVGTAQSIDGTLDHSETLKKLLGDYLDGKKSLPEDLKQVLSGVSADDLQKLTLSAFLADLLRSADGPTKKKIQALAEKARDLGIQ
ncbi:Uncharacterized membrane protein YqiK, contains Band7/PHB/SPFH domain [Nannocystis exedens]|uniref:Uncharacterized membrane protein YqiK, contains Band7/PHB/SPFH domain n=1 Tax=Nannocystis exedens TaxID=54 RepID=A0A1I2AZM9_9BACT|nr:hypothetical protein [Nannocystis exedens]PCC74328.1 Inner membrane protein YqiK [Nannocystis exedens]SFE48463.1 Uncharacterized membrane protein YqiK, contains Band7/PHB/SPFH domain [Nannocystis exedens]